MLAADSLSRAAADGIGACTFACCTGEHAATTATSPVL
jgi:hypothetical protein